MDIFGDFGFVGGEDQTANPYQDNQLCINWYPEISPSKNAKASVSLLGSPGLIALTNQLNLPGGFIFGVSGFGQAGFGASSGPGASSWPPVSSILNQPARASWVLSGSTQALVVIANTVYLVTYSALGSLSTPGVLNTQAVGTLNTSAGFVSIRDDGLGNYAVLVDGPYGYLYHIPTQTFSQITDPAFLGSTTVAFIDGWWIFNVPGTQTFYTNAQPYAITFDATYFANKDAASDKLLAVWESKEELWLIGEKTTEIWYNGGGATFPFQRLVGTMLQTGCKAPGSIARFSSTNQGALVDGLIWLGRSDRGENIVIKTAGFQAEVVSTPAISNAIAQYTVTSDAIGYCYQEGTHEFYVLNFPTADQTWVYDGSMPPELAWTQRLSYDPYAKRYHRHRSNCYMNFAGMRVVGDYQNGCLYQLTRAAYTDAGWPILAKRRAPYVWDKSARGRMFMARLQIEFSPGVGTSSGLGQNPVANLRISRDGTTFGQHWPASLGAIGNWRNRCMWRRLGFGRNNLVEVEVIAPVNRDIVGATLEAFSEQMVG